MLTKPILAGVLSGAALLGGAPAAVASPSRGAALSAPVVHESFTPLPCSGTPNHRDTLQDEGCAEQQILAADRQVNALNRQIFAHLGTMSAKRDFIAGHRAWVGYRHAYCLSVSDVFQGGTEAGVLDAECTAGLTHRHVSDLRDFRTDVGG